MELAHYFEQIWTTGLPVAIGLWLAKIIRTNTKEIKHHNDVSMKKINGTLAYMFKDRPYPIYAKQVDFLPNGQPEFRYLELNGKYAEMLGMTREQCIGKTDLELGHAKSFAEEIHKRDLQVWGTQKEIVYIKDFTDGSQHIFSEEVYTNDKGEVIGVLGYGIGCMAKKLKELIVRLEELQENNNEKKYEKTKKI